MTALSSKVYIGNAITRVTINNSTVSQNTSAGGGGVLNFAGAVIVDSSTMSKNRGTVGGGIFNQNGTALVNRTTISGNEALGNGGGIASSFGGLTVTNSTISRNTALGDPLVVELAGLGTPIATGGGGVATDGPATLTNVTIAGNFVSIPAGVNAGGGGILTSSGLSLSFATVSGNFFFPLRALGGAGILAIGPMTVQNSILAEEFPNCTLVSSGTASTSGGYNIAEDGSCAAFFTQAGDLNGTPAGLDPAGLTNNGGPTNTIALLASSPAVDAIPVANCTDASGNPVATDQRGVPRPQGPACDSGAFEYFASALLLPAVQTFLIIDSVEALPIGHGTQQSLVAKLGNAVDSLNRGNADAATGQLGAFINETNSLAGAGTLTQQQASGLTAAAQAVIQSLGN